jgi:cystathionine gamma-synthase
MKKKHSKRAAKSENLGFSTKAIHAGEKMDAEGSLHTPLYANSNYGFKNTRELLDIIKGKKQGNLYTRYGTNPTINAAERKLAVLEGGKKALTFASGIAAETAALLAHLNPGDEVVALGDLYGGTYGLMQGVLTRFDIRTRFIIGAEAQALKGLAGERTRMIFFESPTNPNLDIFDIKRVAAAARKIGALSVIDNTFASPYNQNPLALGVDLVVHSATKYLGGHSDLTGGVVIGSKKLLEPIWNWRTMTGGIMSPETSFMLLRSLRTLGVRVARQNATALAVAGWLEKQAKVLRVSYPGLRSHAGHRIAKRQMRGFGGMISFEVRGGKKPAAKVAESLKLFALAASLGGVESLVTQPITTTHYAMDPAERKRRGISDGQLRISCGLEESEDLIADLAQALRKA